MQRINKRKHEALHESEGEAAVTRKLGVTAS